MARGVLDVCLCFGCGGVGDVDGEWVGGLDQGLDGWGGVVLCLCEVWVWIICVDGRSRYLYCAWRIPEHLRCTLCSILLQLMDICFLTCICL